MTRTINDSRTKHFDGEAFIACGCVVLMTDNCIYTLSNEEFAGRVAGLIRECGVSDLASRNATVTVDVEAVEVESVDFCDAGFGYPEHRVRSVEYEVRLMTASKGTESFIATRVACNELAEQEQIRGEF